MCVFALKWIVAETSHPLNVLLLFPLNQCNVVAMKANYNMLCTKLARQIVVLRVFSWTLELVLYRSLNAMAEKTRVDYLAAFFSARRGLIASRLWWFTMTRQSRYIWMRALVLWCVGLWCVRHTTLTTTYAWHLNHRNVTHPNPRETLHY